MLAVVFIAAVITGLFLAVEFWRMPERNKAIAKPIEEKTGETGRVTFDKEYFLIKGIIKC